MKKATIYGFGKRTFLASIGPHPSMVLQPAVHEPWSPSLVPTSQRKEHETAHRAMLALMHIDLVIFWHQNESYMYSNLSKKMSITTIAEN